MTMLFTPAKISYLKIPNRLVRSATAEKMADEAGIPQPPYEEMYKALASGGVGLTISGHMYIHPSGKAHDGMTGLDNDMQIDALASTVEAVHQEGGLIAAQINHGGMKAHGAPVNQINLAPSAVETGQFDTKRPTRALNEDEIADIIEDFAEAARRAKQAGFDAVQLHGAHGYLINQFLSPAVNKRQDDWGGSLENRMRFLRAVCHAVRVEVGDDYPLLIKLSVMDELEDGLSLDEGLEVVKELDEMSLDAVEISGGLSKPKHNYASRTNIRQVEEEAYYWPQAKRARQVTDLPLILVGGFRTLNVMEAVLQAGDADFIALCRPLIREPYFPYAMLHNETTHSNCISCNRCFPRHSDDWTRCRHAENSPK